MGKLRLMVKTEIGLEAVAKRELQGLGFEDLNIENGRILLEAQMTDIPKLNINLRTAERVLILCDNFKANTFDQLFEKTKAFPWEEWLVANGKFIVKGRSRNSKLHSVPTCQGVVKKAIIERLKTALKRESFPEDGPEYTIEIALDKDIATLTLDTSGEGLHKRGYREFAGEAPLKETLAAGLVMLSYWRSDRLLLDPLCGSGTIAIEAALLARNIAPGLGRRFAAEEWGIIPNESWRKAKSEALAAINQDVELQIIASDIDSQMIDIAKNNAIEAGVEEDIHFVVQDLAKIDTKPEYGVIITNPPYGERIGNDVELEQLYYKIKKVMDKTPSWSYYVITADSNFENSINRLADRKRKFYNGRIKVDYYQFYGPRPPK